METDLIEMKVKSVSKKMEFTKPNRLATNCMCAVRAEDLHGVEHKAYALGSLCDRLEVGNRVLVTKKPSTKKKDISGGFVIVKKK